MSIDDKLLMYKNCPLREKVDGEELNTLKYKCNSSYELCPMQTHTQRHKYCWYEVIKGAKEKNALNKIPKYQ